MYFEDFQVGQVFCSEPKSLAENDFAGFPTLSDDRDRSHIDAHDETSTERGRTLLHGPHGFAATFGILKDMGVLERTVVAFLDAHLTFTAPLFFEDEIVLRMLVTRCRRTPDGESGIVNRHLRVTNQDGAVVQEGASAMLVHARGPCPDGEREERARRDFGSLAWGQHLARRLASDDAFAHATIVFDGAIGLQAGTEVVFLKTYLGRVIDVVSRPQLSGDFIVRGSEAAWAELALADRNDYIARAMHGEFSISGSNYQYLRLTRAVVSIMGSVQAMAQEDDSHAEM